MGMSCLALGLLGRVSCNCHVLLTSLRDRLEISAQCHFSFLYFSFGFINGKIAKQEGSPIFFTKEEGPCTGTAVNGPIVAVALASY